MCTSSNWVSRGWASVSEPSVPSEVKSFLWRALSDCPPSMMNLIFKMVIADPSCQLSPVRCETTMHALFYCDCAKEVWQLTQFVEIVMAVSFGSVWAAFGFFISVLSNA